MPQDKDDILQQAILDVNKIKQVSLKVAQEKLHQQFSSDLKKKYMQSIAENLGANDDVTLFEDINDIFGGEAADAENTGEDTPGDAAGQAKPGEPASPPGAQGGLTPPPTGENGLPPQAGAVDSQVMQSDIPVAGVDDAPDGSVIVLNIGDGDSPFDLAASEADLKAQTSQALAAQTAPPLQTNSNVPGGAEDPANSMLPPGEQGKREDDSLFAGIFEEEDPYVTSTPMESSLKISDEILLEYIQKSLYNEEKFDNLAAEITELQKTVKTLSNQLVKSNSDLTELKEQNIRLMYKNKALNDDSLSEPQKQNIVKALDKAKTLNEAKTVYETVASSFTKPNNKPKDVNALIADNATKKFLQEGKTKQNIEEKVELTSIAQKLFEKWGIS